MHESVWGLAGRSQDAAKAAAETDEATEAELLDLESAGTRKASDREIADEIEEIDRELEAQGSPPAATPGSAPMEYQRHRRDRAVKEEKGGGCLPGCLVWVVGLLGIGALALVVLFSLDVLSPRDKPCPLTSPPIPTPALIATAGDLFRNECVRVRGTIVFQAAGELVVRDGPGRVRAARERSATLLTLLATNPRGPRGHPGWMAQSGGGPHIRSPLYTGPWSRPRVVAEPPGEPRRAVLGGAPPLPPPLEPDRQSPPRSCWLPGYHTALSPTTTAVSPIAGQLHDLRERTATLGEFVRTVARFNTYDAFLAYLEQ